MGVKLGTLYQENKYRRCYIKIPSGKIALVFRVVGFLHSPAYICIYFLSNITTFVGITAP